MTPRPLWRLPNVDIQEADIAAMGRADVEELIDRAVRPDVPLRVFFAALDRYTELLRPVPEEAAATEPASGPAAEARPAGRSAEPPAAPGPSGLSGFSAVSDLPGVIGLQGRSGPETNSDPAPRSR